MNEFFNDIWRGLNASPKYLQSKYFYDEAGDAIFKEIMECPEYYLTRCELDIFSSQSRELANLITGQIKEFDVVELGPGDCTKSVHLFRELIKQKPDFTYYPIDISKNVITSLYKELPAMVPGLEIQGLNGDYFDMLAKMNNISGRSKVVLFLGSTIGNIPIEENVGFLKALRSYLSPGDLIIIGFDLKKDPKIVLDAYNDKGGITKRFNLNLLTRINQTFAADFDLNLFEHKPVYCEETGACKSYLKSVKEQTVQIADTQIHFKEGEQILMEVSQKYTVEQTNAFAKEAGFLPLQHFYDSKGWFADVLWQTQ